MKRSLSKEELWVLSYYRASELAGALFFGRLARRMADDELRVFLTEHFAEEANHAWLWTETIRRLGHYPVQITETYQSRYSTEIGIPTTLAEILMITKIFEERIYQHFSKHAQRKDLNPILKATLKKMLDDEEGHLGWIEKKLVEEKKRGVDIRALEQRFRKVDENIYKDMLEHEQTLSRFLSKQAAKV